MGFELRHLRAFVAVAEELNFTRAAARLHVAQPALSTQVRQLEAGLGVELFDRSRRAIRLTPAGAALLPEARRLLAGVDQTVRIVRGAGDGEVGHLTVGFVPSAANSGLPEHLRAFRRQRPGVELYLRELAPDDLVRALREGGVDVGFLYLPHGAEEIATHVVERERLVAALPADHRLAGRRRVRAAELADEPFVLPARHQMPGLLAQVEDACRAGGFTPRAVQKDVWLMQTIVGLVAAGMGVALVPASVENLRRTGVAYRPLSGAAATVELGAIWRRDERLPPLASFLRVLGAPVEDPRANHAPPSEWTGDRQLR